MKLALIIGGVLAAGFIALAAPVAFGAWNPWASSYPQGVDVSAHQGPIDWRTLSATVRFAYIKATEGADYVDPRFAFNWSEAKRVGLAHGAYHYFTLCRTGAQQAKNFLDTVPRDAGTMPLAVDLEHMGVCRRGPTLADPAREIHAFLDIVQKRTGARPILYTSQEFHDAHLTDFRGERFWIRSLVTPPAFRQREWVLWQYHNMARRRGISGPVDLDAFRGDERAFQRFRGGAT